MKKTIHNYWKKTENLRSSMPDFFRNNVFASLDDDPTKPKKSLSEQINDRLMKYKEFKAVYKKTHIRPVYFFYILVVCLLFIVVGFFDKYLTILIATVYPLYISRKTLQSKIGEEKADGGIYDEEDKKKDVTQWLSYWVVYSVFINFESIFGFVLKYIPFYFFIKVIFLLFCFLPQYQLAWWLYDHCIRTLFNKYESHIINFSNKIYRSITIGNEESDTISQDKVNKAVMKILNIKKKNDNSIKKEEYAKTEGNVKEEEKKEEKQVKTEANEQSNEEKLDDSAIFEEDDDDVAVSKTDVNLTEEDSVNIK